MGDFSFSSTAQCNYCGNLLSHSDEECDQCSPEMCSQHVFRRVSSADGKAETIVVEATMEYRWYKLEESVGDDWKAYEWLGPRESVQNMVGRYMWETIQDIPKRQMAHDAPSDVGSDD